jgi:Fe-S cluster assembly protein SufD
MTVALTRTKAEQALSRSFEAIAGKLPGNRTVAEARKAAIGAFAALGLPHRRIEQWKYTDLRSALK